MTVGPASRFWSLVAALLGCGACKDQEGVLQEPQLRPKLGAAFWNLERVDELRFSFHVPVNDRNPTPEHPDQCLAS